VEIKLVHPLAKDKNSQSFQVDAISVLVGRYTGNRVLCEGKRTERLTYNLPLHPILLYP